MADSIGEFAAPRQKRVARDNHEYTAYEFDTTLVARKPGKATLGPAEVRFDVLASASGPAAFFGGTEARSVTVRSEAISLTILSPPERGRPEGYSGTVGRFKITRDVVPAEVRQGDPVTLTTRIEGVGNIDSITCPSVALPGVRSYPPRARATASRLTCEQVLVPDVAADVEIPEAGVVAFDPRSERYQTLRSAPVRVKVEATVVGEAAAATPAPATPSVEKADRPAEGRSPVAPVLAAAGVLLLAALAWLARRRNGGTRLAEAPAPGPNPTAASWLAEAERASAANDPARFHTAAYRALQGHLGTRYGLPASGITEAIVTRVMRPAGAEEHLLEACAQLFATSNRARYAPGGAEGADMAETLRLLRSLVRSA